MNRVELSVLGITYSQIKDGVYAMILAQKDGVYRIPVVVGIAEAQSIAVKLEGVTTQRPLVYDLFVSFSQAFGVNIKEVFINRFEEGIFFSEVKFVDQQGSEVVLDARTSDAIAIAMRSGVPIYTTQELMVEAGFIPEGEGIKEGEVIDKIVESVDIKSLPTDKLRELMDRCVELEDYEVASEIKRIIADRESRGEQ